MPSEFACSCCGENLIRAELVEELEGARQEAGFPIHVTSGYRCPAYNVEISSTGPDGPHTTGLASDIWVPIHRWRRLTSILDHRFKGLGYKFHGPVMTRFAHVDLLRPRIYTYPE